MAILNSNILHIKDANKKLVQMLMCIRNFYYGDMTVTVTGDFDKASVFCYYHGYMGGKFISLYQ